MIYVGEIISTTLRQFGFPFESFNRKSDMKIQLLTIVDLNKFDYVNKLMPNKLWSNIFLREFNLISPE